MKFTDVFDFRDVPASTEFVRNIVRWTAECSTKMGTDFKCYTKIFKNLVEFYIFVQFVHIDKCIVIKIFYFVLNVYPFSNIYFMLNTEFVFL